MSTGIFFLIEALIYMILLLFIYFNKKRFKSEENKIYTFLMLTSLTELLLELILDYVGPMYETIPLISYLIARLYCIFLQLWITTLCLYRETAAADKFPDNGIVRKLLARDPEEILKEF